MLIDDRDVMCSHGCDIVGRMVVCNSVGGPPTKNQGHTEIIIVKWGKFSLSWCITIVAGGRHSVGRSS